MKTFTTQAAQGDLLIRRIDKLPAGLTPAKAEAGQFVLAHSETGHNHVIAERPNIRVHSTDDPLLSYLEVIEATDEAEALIEHLRTFDTHETLQVPPGIYEIRRQREYSPEGWRRVAD
jgi:hypothetical protein